MRNNLRFVLAALAVGIVVGVGIAAIVNHVGRNGFDRRFGKMSAALGLDAKQRVAVRAVLEKRHGEMEKAMSPCIEKGKALREATEAEIRAVLTPDQQKTFDKLREKRRGKGPHHGEGRECLGPGGMGPGHESGTGWDGPVQGCCTHDEARSGDQLGPQEFHLADVIRAGVLRDRNDVDERVTF